MNVNFNAGEKSQQIATRSVWTNKSLATEDINAMTPYWRCFNRSRRIWCESSFRVYSHQSRVFFCCGNSAADISKSPKNKKRSLQTFTGTDAPPFLLLEWIQYICMIKLYLRHTNILLGLFRAYIQFVCQCVICTKSLMYPVSSSSICLLLACFYIINDQHFQGRTIYIKRMNFLQVWT